MIQPSFAQIGLLTSDIGIYSSIGRRTYAPAWWVVAGKTCIAAYQPIGAASLAASYINLANPGTYDAAPGVAPTFNVATGWTFNGSTQYLLAPFVVGAGWSAIAQITGGNPVAGNREIFGSSDTAVGGFQLIPNYTGGVMLSVHGAVNVSKVPGMTAGNYALTPNAAYRNGVFDAAITANWSGVAAQPSQCIGAIYTPGGVSAYWPGNIRALAIYSGTLTAGEVLAVSTAMAALT